MLVLKHPTHTWFLLITSRPFVRHPMHTWVLSGSVRSNGFIIQASHTCVGFVFPHKPLFYFLLSIPHVCGFRTKMLVRGQCPCPVSHPLLKGFGTAFFMIIKKKRIHAFRHPSYMHVFIFLIF